MAATMTTMPRLGDDATLLSARLATTTPRSSDDTILGNNATPHHKPEYDGY
jgi:hypothetical protein